MLKQSLVHASIVADNLLQTFIVPRALLQRGLSSSSSSSSSSDSMMKKKKSEQCKQQLPTAEAMREYVCSLFGAPLYGKGVTAVNRSITADSFPSTCTDTAVHAIRSIAMLLHLALEEDAKV